MEYDELTVDDIKTVWDLLDMPKLEQIRVVYEHSQWWVTGWNCENEECFYSVVEAVGSGTCDGIAFERC